MRRKSFSTFIGATIFLSLVSWSDSRSFPAARTRPSGATPESQINGFYFGYSDVPAGRIGWFLQLDNRTQSGKIYLPPQVLTLTNLVVTRDGKVSFQFEDNIQARFVGDVTAGITGKFSYSNGRSSDTNLTRIEEKWLTHEEVVFAGLYSSVKFVEKAGDLVGAELLLIPQAVGLGGILTLYEGVPGNIYALTNLQIKNDTIRFAIVTSGGIRNFIGHLSSEEIIIRQIVNESSERDPIALPKRRKLVDSLSSHQTTVP